MNNKLTKELMTSPAIYWEEQTPIKDVISLMKDNNIGFIPITKNKILIGVVTDRDILIRGVGVYKLNTKINKIMTNGEIYFVSPDTPVEEAAKKMAEHKIRRLVVLENGYVAGVLTTKNLLNEPTLLKYITQTYIPTETIKNYSMYTNSNPHDSVKAADYPL